MIYAHIYVQGHDGEVFTFDPYTILGIETDTSANTIKKVYRKYIIYKISFFIIKILVIKLLKKNISHGLVGSG